MFGRTLGSLFFVLVTVWAVAAGCYSQGSGQKVADESGQIQNHIGDLRFRYKDYDEVTVPERLQASETDQGEKSLVSSAAASGKNPPQAGRGEIKAEGNSVLAGGGAEASSGREPSPGGAEASAGREPSPGGAGSLREQIEQKYLARLQALASGYEAKLNGLIISALNECRAARKENPNADLTPIFKRYYLAGRALEAECDSQFYPVLADFESELKANSFPLEAAVRAREVYEARKNTKAGEITPAGR